MADLSKEFKTFHDKIVLNNGRKEYLRKSRDAVRERIRQYFKEQLKVDVPKFYMQGSYAMGTIVMPIDGEYDIDDGVYLQHLDANKKDEWPTPATVHQWLVNSTDGHTKETPIDKKTCVRVRYAGQYHVDLPIYATHINDYMLAEKGERGWHGSDSKALTDWYKRQVKTNGEQLRQMVRYLKAWADYQTGRRGKMPSGLILTVMAAENFRSDSNDDVALSKTITAIADSTKTIFFVSNPVDISEELTSRLTEIQKDRFKDAISDFSTDASEAVEIADEEKASKLWRRQFGERFPVAEKNEDGGKQKETVAKTAAVYTDRNPIKPWGNY